MLHLSFGGAVLRRAKSESAGADAGDQCEKMNTAAVTCHVVTRFKNCDAGTKEKAIGKIAFQNRY